MLLFHRLLRKPILGKLYERERTIATRWDQEVLTAGRSQEALQAVILRIDGAGRAPAKSCLGCLEIQSASSRTHPLEEIRSRDKDRKLELRLLGTIGYIS